MTKKTKSKKTKSNKTNKSNISNKTNKSNIHTATPVLGISEKKEEGNLPVTVTFVTAKDLPGSTISKTIAFFPQGHLFTSIHSPFSPSFTTFTISSFFDSPSFTIIHHPFIIFTINIILIYRG